MYNYGSLEPQGFNYISEQSYFNNKYYVEKDIFVAYLYSRYFKRLIRHETHLGELITKEQKIIKEKNKKDNYNIEYLYDYVVNKDLRTNPPSVEIILHKDLKKHNEEDENKRLAEMRKIKGLENIKSLDEIPIERVFENDCDKMFAMGVKEAEKYYKNQDLTKELEIYCPNPKPNKKYFYKSAFYKDKELPSFHTIESDYSCDFMNDYFGKEKCSLNKMNLKFYSDIVGSFINSSVQEGRIKINSQNMYNDTLHRLTKVLTGIYHYNFYNLLLREIDEKINNYNEPFIGIYFKQVIESILKTYFSDGSLSRCAYCNKIMMKITPTKIYCSKNIEGSDCGKKARNATYYRKSTKIKNK